MGILGKLIGLVNGYVGKLIGLVNGYVGKARKLMKLVNFERLVKLVN
jgi:hypothetical protein